jgi:hypothetical protein
MTLLEKTQSADLSPTQADLSPIQAWSRRVRRIGGFIQVAFAAFWLVRGSLNIQAGVGIVVAGGFGITVVGVSIYGFRSAHAAPRPTGAEANRIERAVSIATVVQLVASFAAPAIVVLAGHPDWVLPSIAVTIGPLLLWLDHRVDIPRYRTVGWALITGPMVLVATLSGAALAATTGIAAGLLLLGSAAAGFHDLASGRTLASRSDQSVADR